MQKLSWWQHQYKAVFWIIYWELYGSMPDSSCSSSIPPVVFFKVKKYVSSKSVFPVLPFLYVAFMFLQFGVNWRVHFPEVLSYCYSSKAYYSSNNKTKQNRFWIYKPWEVFGMQGCGGGGKNCGNKTLTIFLFKKQKCSCFFSR